MLFCAGLRLQVPGCGLPTLVVSVQTIRRVYRAMHLAMCTFPAVQIPIITLLPPDHLSQYMVAGMMIHNIQPGPQVMTSNPELFWGLIASMWIGNLMLIVLNLPLIGIWVRLLELR